MTQRLTYWYPAICVAILISVFSTHAFSGDQTAHIIIPILRWLLPSASLHTLRLIHFGIRKAAHITEFGVFGPYYANNRGELRRPRRMASIFCAGSGGQSPRRPDRFDWRLARSSVCMGLREAAPEFGAIASAKGESFLATEVVSCRYGITADASFELMLSSPLPSTAVVT